MMPFLPASFIEHLQCRPCNDTVFHYTPQSGVLGIIKSKELWASQVQYMNDSTEYNSALQLANDILKKRSSEANSATSNTITRIRDMIAKIGDVRIFACSFCEDGDLLSQWRGYSGSGYGFSVGLRADALADVGKNTDPEFRFGRCIYDDDLKKKIVEETFEHCLSPNIASPGLGSAVAPIFASTLMQCAAFFKDASFSEEKEWRLVSFPVLIPHCRVDFRLGRSMVIPYFKLALDEFPNGKLLHHIIVGPCPHKALSRNSVLELLRQHQTPSERGGRKDDDLVRCSEIPYRDW